MGNLDALRDWGHAKDYVYMQWLMLQQEKPDDYVIATGNQISVREFIMLTAKNLGIELEFKGSGLDEKGIVKSIQHKNLTPSIKVGDVIVSIDSSYFRPAEVETLLGDPSKAKNKLQWEPKISIDEMCSEMIAEDLKIAQKNALLQSHGFDISSSNN